MTLIFNGNTIVNASFPLRQSLNNGQTKAYMGMPQKFAGADGGASFAMGRNTFIRGSTLNQEKNADPKNADPKNANPKNGKPIKNTSSDLYIQRKKNNAIGRGSTKQALATNEIISFKNVNVNTTNAALRKARSSGCVAPAKKGALHIRS